MEIKLTSKSFSNEGFIPSKYTCEGENISPHLSWEDAPNGTKSFALTVIDTDAASGNFVHWIVFNIPSNIKNLQENLQPTRNTPDEVRFGTNNFGRLEYGGPCPPSGIHNYHFKIYALNSILHLDSGATIKDLTFAMNKHILSEGEIIGKYKKQK